MTDIVDDIVADFAREMRSVNGRDLEVISRIIVAGRRFEDSAAKALRVHGLGYTDFDVLGMLRVTPAPHALTPKTLIRRTMVTSGAMTTCLDRLERAGLIERRQGTEDRRERIVTLTGKGKVLIEKAFETRMQALQPMLATWSVDDKKRLIALLKAGTSSDMP